MRHVISNLSKYKLFCSFSFCDIIFLSIPKFMPINLRTGNCLSFRSLLDVSSHQNNNYYSYFFMASRIGVDIGGTFTDFIVYDESGNRVIIDKIPNYLENPPAKQIISNNGMSNTDISKILDSLNV